MAKQLTAYCGLYCKDCIPSKRKFFETAKKLSGMLEEIQFTRYAGLKAEKNRVFDGYPGVGKEPVSGRATPSSYPFFRKS